ncbi:hypothetical protein tloyanaT_32470 [Thalassotalea loyana]|uniref:DUF4194 domain-containing protein n=1 Tax=Thalassotalea loyana TaxID=280483 RepID=A0ABQ6HH75_9GAMM|nr:hypothetical protein [Thalassotalea loyana]GLX86994.1 hypothetical protein tloyanaT_32470 [Thalassotalea loyana]
MNSNLSKQIFNILMNGKVINKNTLDVHNDDIIEDKLFTELMSNYVQYKDLYFNCGYELVDNVPESFFIRALNEEQSNSKLSSKIQALLIVIARGVTLDNYELDILFDSHAGLSKELVEKINKNEEFRTVLDATRIEENLWDECKKLLVDRNIAVINRSGNYVLLNSGKSMYEALINQGASEIV